MKAAVGATGDPSLGPSMWRGSGRLQNRSQFPQVSMDATARSGVAYEGTFRPMPLFSHRHQNSVPNLEAIFRLHTKPADLCWGRFPGGK